MKWKTVGSMRAAKSKTVVHLNMVISPVDISWFFLVEMGGIHSWSKIGHVPLQLGLSWLLCCHFIFVWLFSLIIPVVVNTPCIKKNNKSYSTSVVISLSLLQDRLGVRPHVIQIKLPQENIIKYGLRLGDEMILAALSVFKPEAFGLQGPQLIRTQPRGESDPEDPYDQDYLRRTSRQSQGVTNYQNVCRLVYGELLPRLWT